MSSNSANPKQGEPARAVVMNLFYTGLGIARSLGEQGIPVIGLTSKRGIYGNYTRYAKAVIAPDSREEPEALAAFLTGMGREMKGPGVLFPTRDDDLMFLDRFRAQLEPYFRLVMPESDVLRTCLNKWETSLAASRAGVASPKCWVIESAGDLDRVAVEASYPCVLKPLAAHHWRQRANWQIVGARKAIAIDSPEALRAEYETIARADERALVQEMIPGGDDQLLIAACYMDRESRWVAGFNTQKLVQIPEGFGTGCIVQSVSKPELFERTARLLQSIGYSGIAEVEYKWDAASNDYQLIEINPRPWDQHRLGNACGVDLMYLAYCDRAGLPLPPIAEPAPGHKWIAEDAFLTAAVGMLWRRDPQLRSLLRQTRGRRIFAIWSARDPLPLLSHLAFRFLPELAGAAVRNLWSAIKRIMTGRPIPEKGLVYEGRLEKPKSLG